MNTRILPNLMVPDCKAAVDFYTAAFLAEVVWSYPAGDDIGIALLSISDAQFLVADDSPEFGTPGPSRVGVTTVRIDLLVDDPDAVHRQAVAAGGIEIEPVVDHLQGPRMGAVEDPFGHRWLIGAPWSPAAK